jgi:dihydrofolate reductase
MSAVTCQLSISLDGYVAGPNQSLQDPIGEGGMRLHDWVLATASWQEQHGGEGGEHGEDSEVAAEATKNIGAYIMGRNMFGGGTGPWDESWRGWWDEDPPYHVPVFVLSHHERAPLPMLGGTTFTFVNNGIEDALAQAREAAAGRDVSIAGGASTVRQFLAAGLLDELQLHIAPVILGAGERLLDGVGNVELEQLSVIGSSAVTHIKYRIVH